MRDRVVRRVLGCGALVAVLTWRFVGEWPAMVLVVLAIVVAAIVYRIEPPRIDLHGSHGREDARGRSSSRVMDQ